MFLISCTECGVFICRTREELRGHLECEHGINMETRELVFNSMEQFLQWKSKIEGDEVTFSKRAGEQKVNSEKSCLYYNCNYSRTAVEGCLGKRLKASPRIVEICPASLVVSKMSSGKINVKFYMTHIGHSLSMESHRLSVGSHNRTYAKRAKVVGHIVPVTNGTDGITVGEDSVTQDLQHRSPGPVIVAVEQNDVMSWQQELQHSSSGPIIVAVEPNYVISWQQELPHSSAVPVSVTVDETWAMPWQEEVQHSTAVPGSVTVEENDAQPCQQELQHSTLVPGSVTVEENDAQPCQQELQHSTSDVCGNTDYCEALCEICGLSFKCRKSLYKHLRESHDMDINLNEGNKKCYISEKTFSGLASLSFDKEMHTAVPQNILCTECGVFKCCTSEELRFHLECDHGINMKTEELEFDSMEQFIQWKKKLEGDEKVFFTKLSNEQMVNNEKSRLYYTCLNSQTAVERGLGKRLRATAQTVQTCPASLTVSKMSSGKIGVEYYKTHTGHGLFMESHSLSVGSHARTYTKRAKVAGHIVPVPNITDGGTVEEDSATPWQHNLQNVSPGFETKHCVAVEHNYAM